MESMTMTNATRISRDRFGCPLTDGALLPMSAAAAQHRGTTVSAFGFGIDGGIATDRPVVAYVPARKPSTTDVVRSRTWRPPV
ncbi:MAG TPA: hypothetical protein VFL99_17120 [Segeticoccus sp.]|uniref:hypothetical protein n=1 Tax=Segeticoccus sp. TaxID=2706531 RepID=UPI002D7F7496|nr:hypothetical protein [Segeticoccus sp.]HET8602050.1 hypothetical protein [Segeticoccus sp.]